MAILKPLIKSELLGLLSFTSKGPKDLFPLALLPEVIILIGLCIPNTLRGEERLTGFLAFQDYGGTLSSLEKYHNDQRRMLENDYRDWLLETNQFKELPKEAASNNNSYSVTNQNMSRQNSIKSLGRQTSTSSTTSSSSQQQQKTPEPTRQKYKKAVRGLKNLEID